MYQARATRTDRQIFAGRRFRAQGHRRLSRRDITAFGAVIFPAKNRQDQV